MRLRSPLREVHMQYGPRVFQEDDWYVLRSRTVTGETSNRVWLYTVDAITDAESNKTFLALVRWRARIDGTGSAKKIWDRYRSYNVRSVEQWEGASRAVDAYFHNTPSLTDPGFVRVDLPMASSGTEAQAQEMTALQEELAESRAAEQFHRAEKRRVEQRLREMKRHIRSYRSMLRDFEALVSDGTSNETKVHDFIESREPFWLFGLEYSDLASHVRFPPRTGEFEFDFMLQRYDGYQDLVELKGPNEALFDRRTKRRSKLNVHLSEALGQVLTYLNECDKQRSSTLFKPKALIVIGNRETDNTRQRRLLTSHLTRVEILTYTELLEHGKRLLKHIEAW